MPPGNRIGCQKTKHKAEYNFPVNHLFDFDFDYYYYCDFAIDNQERAREVSSHLKRDEVDLCNIA